MEQEKKNLVALVLKHNETDERTKLILELLKKYKFEVIHQEKTVDAIKTFDEKNPFLVVSALGIGQNDLWEPLISHIREVKKNKQTYICIFSTTASENPKTRELLYTKKCNMVTQCLKSLENLCSKIQEIQKINSNSSKEKQYQCTYCQISLPEDSLWYHLPLYHINEPLGRDKCPICNYSKNDLQGHFYNTHGLCKKGIVPHEHHDSQPVYAFSLVVVQRETDGKYLLVHERSESGYWLPGGRVDPGESLEDAAIRECKEEAGVDIELTGVLQFCFNNKKDHVRVRVIFMAKPKDSNQQPKTLPDYESNGGIYVQFSDLSGIQLRGEEPVEWISYLEKGGKIHPLSILTTHG